MSQNENDSGHEGTFNTPKQVITVLAIAFLVPFVIAVLVLQFIANLRSVDKASPAMLIKAVSLYLKMLRKATLR